MWIDTDRNDNHSYRAESLKLPGIGRWPKNTQRRKSPTRKRNTDNATHRYMLAKQCPWITRTLVLE